jgi:hypothetical protein
MRNIALMGRARSGKDSVAARLVSEHGYMRVAFADPLKEMALSLNPIIRYERAGGGYLACHLSQVVSWHGWEYAKDNFPEVRRVLQRLGQAVRDGDPDFWLRQALMSLDMLALFGLPAVVTDVRYPNEADALKARGFTLVRMTRAQQLTDGHESENALGDYAPDMTLTNDGTLADLAREVDKLA